MFYPEIINRYIGVLKENSIFLQPTPSPDYPFLEEHLYWMLLELLDNPEQSLTKKHRWLGFVQGVMAYKGYLDVQEERDLTRGIFLGK
ncbi:hypothetical protein P13BB106kb_p041 [Pectobacterium phage DU_PP_V]|uniref:Uncharacterized protein n=1 Tax=Pectobacterium phage DU_PP_V TaxID=2041492 RepID=A0A2D2W6V3_9CAUD|nr:hypothetical protein HOS40_gp041 [Pectobacterium phage DU_PP_V]ATS94025.1 hypothetical protein P13BB106kb_p041 [Pectobacterium phage DU_PP_V]